MALYVGKFLLTGEFLNRVAAPYLLGHYRFLSELTFRVAGSTIAARVAGRYTLLRFKGSISAELLQFRFQPSAHRVLVELSLDLQPHMIKPLVLSLLEKNLASRDGVTWSGQRLSLDLDRLPFFNALRDSPGGDNILSLLRINPDERTRSDGITFNIYLKKTAPGPLGDDKEGRVNPPAGGEDL
ncbi:MAG TPA: hypothetical protein GX744_06875 [Firmicutes bacterium]|nr:hypothetical protein [Bacillota bacterium]